MLNIKIDILKAFLDNTELFESMNSCNHYENSNNFNPYHLEGSLWTHTMLVYNAANSEDYIELIMALCHDIGKVITRKVNDNGKVSFYGHADASIQPTIDFVNYLYTKNIINRKEFDNFLKFGLPAMANHMIYYKNRHKLNYFSNNNTIIKNYYKKMNYIDSIGSICEDDDDEENVIKDFVLKPFDKDQPTITIWTGLPGSGKDYLAKKTGDPIVSWDDIRVEIYKNYVSENYINMMTNKEIYENAFKYCKEKNININKLMKRKINDIVKTEKNINICNTSLTRKSRRNIINTISTKYNYVIKQVFVPTKLIYERNTIRDSKTVPINVINNMMKNMTIATYFEKNINNIEYILNI